MLVTSLTSKKSQFDARKRAQAAIYNTFIADSLAMPVHWYYRTADIYRQFSDGVSKFEAAPEHHPSSIMNLHSTKHGGRKGSAAANKQVVGEVILKDKAQYWNRVNMHYHQGMPAGENTLNAHTVLWLLESMIEHEGLYDEDTFLGLYIEKMTADVPQHPDTYAESYHRGFFANWVAGKAPNACGAVTHDTASVGGLVRVGPLALLLLLQGQPLAAVKSTCVQHLKLTHPDEGLTRVCFNYIDLINALLINDDPSQVQAIIGQTIKHSTQMNIDAAQAQLLVDNYVVGSVYSTACYITDSWPALLYLAYKYWENPKQALINNTNLGGDNVHRGAVLGVILGLANPVDLRDQYGSLKNQSLTESQIDRLPEMRINHEKV